MRNRHRMGTRIIFFLHYCEIEDEKRTPPRGIEPATLRSAMVRRAALLVSFFRLVQHPGIVADW